MSLCDNHTGKFLGGIVLNEPSVEAAEQEAVQRLYAKTGFASCVQCLAAPIPVGAMVPSGVYGRLMDLPELEAVHGKWLHKIL